MSDLKMISPLYRAAEMLRNFAKEEGEDAIAELSIEALAKILKDDVLQRPASKAAIAAFRRKRAH
jgi:hypothetical protein